MLKALFRVRLAALKSWFTGSSRSKKAQSKGKMIGFAFLMLYAFFALGLVFWNTFDTLALPFHMAGLDWLYFTMAALIGFALMFVGSVFTAKAQLYEAKDNDLLLSMPIKPGYILLSRMFMLWIITLAFELMAAIPALLAWHGEVGFAGGGLAIYLLIFVLLLPLFALAISALFGWLLHLVTARVRNKSLVTVLLSLLFLGVYFVFIFRMQSLIEELAMNADSLAGSLGAVAPLYWIGAAVAAGDLAALLRVTLLLLAVFALTCVLLGKTFLHTATSNHGTAKKKYVERTEEVLSPRRALLRREWKRFLASPAYILNCGLGAMMAIVGAVVLIIKRQALLDVMAYGDFSELLAMGLVLSLCFMAGTILITAPSVSLEGKTLWISQSIPVETAELLRAKLRVHLLFGVPPVFLASVAAAAVLKPDALTLLSMLLLPSAFCVFIALLGLAENLRHPNFDWVNESQAVKSGASILLTMFISWGLLLVPVLLGIFLDGVLSLEAVALVFLALVVLASVLLYRWLMRRGVEIYRTL